MTSNRQFKILVDVITKSITKASDEEIHRDAIEAGVDLDANAAELKQMFLASLSRYESQTSK